MESQKKSSIQSHNIVPRILLGLLFCALSILMYQDATTTQHTTRQQQENTSEENSKHDIQTIQEGALFITPEMLEQDQSMLRNFIVRQLIAQGFKNFVKFPYAGSGNNTITSISMGSGYEVISGVDAVDDLDLYIANSVRGSGDKNMLFIQEDIRELRGPIYLFKNTQDLKHMGYEVVSHRTRISKDDEYRRFNIAQSFTLLGHVRILLPGESLNFMVDAQYDEEQRINYVEGYAIIDGEEEKDYGGGMCGASTAIYQGILTNSGLKVTKLRNHSKWFSNLYTATINHKRISTPGIDSAVYHGQIDLSMSNISPYPIVLVMNYDGSYGGAEEVFTLSLAPTKGAFSFVQGGKQRRTEEVEDPNGSGTISTTVNAGGCYTRLINGEKQTSCYKEVW